VQLELQVRKDSEVIQVGLEVLDSLAVRDSREILVSPEQKELRALLETLES